LQIKNLYIKDFGIFNNQTLNNLDSNIIVIGGLNRAGKTTLMNVLQYMGYGFPRGKNLPPATNRYEVEGDLLLDNQKYKVQLNGYGKPIINAMLNDDVSDISSIKDIYHLDYFTYQQLFTVSLDELKRIPDGVEDKEKLQSILIGAGFSEMIHLPQWEEYFNKQADKIGGKNGTPSVRQFKPY
jgi:uncharacterized protein YhaN